jgi:hypothetical protein
MDRLLSRITHFEAVGDPVADVGAAEPAAPAAEPAAAAAPEPAAEPWRQEIETLGDHLATIAQNQEYLHQQMQPPPPQQAEPTGPEWDPLNPDAYLEHQIEQRAQAMIEERLGPLEPILGSVAEQEGERVARGEFERIGSEIGKFDQDQALLGVQALISAGVDPMQAVQAAAHRQHEYEARLKTEWEAERQAHIESLRDVPDEPGTGAGGAVGQQARPTNAAEAQAMGGPSKYENVGLRLIESRRPATAG